METHVQLQLLAGQIQSELTTARQAVTRLTTDLPQGLERAQGSILFVEQLFSGFMEVAQHERDEVSRRLEKLEHRVTRLEPPRSD